MRLDPRIPRAAIILAMLGSCLAMTAPAFAAGDSGGTTKTCPPGEIYDARANGCVKQKGGALSDPETAKYAYALAKEERYAEALDVLNLLKNPNTPEALNYRGYATRKLGRIDEGIGYYKQSIALDPRYAQVREYLGEAYVIKGDLARAEAQLEAIKTICGTNCPEYEHLALAITDRAPRW